MGEYLSNKIKTSSLLSIISNTITTLCVFAFLIISLINKNTESCRFLIILAVISIAISAIYKFVNNLFSNKIYLVFKSKTIIGLVFAILLTVLCIIVAIKYGLIWLLLLFFALSSIDITSDLAVWQALKDKDLTPIRYSPDLDEQVHNIVDVYPKLEERIAYKDIKKVKESKNFSKLSKL